MCGFLPACLALCQTAFDSVCFSCFVLSMLRPSPHSYRCPMRHMCSVYISHQPDDVCIA